MQYCMCAGTDTMMYKTKIKTAIKHQTARETGWIVASFASDKVHQQFYCHKGEYAGVAVNSAVPARFVPAHMQQRRQIMNSLVFDSSIVKLR